MPSVETKSFGGIWSSGEDSMTLYMGGRQIFETSHEVHIREDNNKLNKQVTDKLLVAGSRWIPARYPKYMTGTDIRSVRAQTLLSLTQAYNTGDRAKYPVFAIILALCRSIQSTNKIRQLYTLGYSAYSCLIGLVDLIGGHSAMNLAKSLIVSNKTISVTAHLCSETEVFETEIPTNPSRDRFDTQEESMLLTPT
jgi:hypothetical protein